jgi:hypothetical protein
VWDSNWAVYTGTLIRSGQGSDLYAPSGISDGKLIRYVDCYYNSSQNCVVNKYDARHADGSLATLSSIRFVKVQTAWFYMTELFGDISTEIVSATGLPDQSEGFPNPLGAVSSEQ